MRLSRQCGRKRILAPDGSELTPPIAEAEKMSKSYVEPNPPLALLAPDLVEAILGGGADQRVMLERPLPVAWEEQRRTIAPSQFGSGAIPVGPGYNPQGSLSLLSGDQGYDPSPRGRHRSERPQANDVAITLYELAHRPDPGLASILADNHARRSAVLIYRPHVARGQRRTP